MFELIYPADPAEILPRRSASLPGGFSIRGVEMLPIVQKNGIVSAQAPREYCHSGTMLCHPTVHMHIINRYEKLYLQKRAENKNLCPGMWDTAVGGHVAYGETLSEALFRESAEELGFYDFNPIYLKSYIFNSDVEQELVNIFAAVGNFELHPDNDEVSEGRYWSMEEIEDNMGKGVFTPNFELEFPEMKRTLLALL